MNEFLHNANGTTGLMLVDRDGGIHRCVIDTADFAEVIKHQWSARHSNRRDLIYVNTNIDGKTILLHQFLSGSLHTDHKNGNGLDNRRSNLRIASQRQNNYAKRKQLGKYTSKFKGVTYRKREQLFSAQITINGKQKSLGYFTDETEAAKAYDRAARQLFGEFAVTNFPLEENNV